MKHRLFIAYIAVLLAFCLPLHTRTVDEAGKVLALPQKAPVALVQLDVQPIEEVQEVGEPAAVAAPIITTVSQEGCGDNFYANYIYTHESGCVPDRVNSIGCLGIGQSCSPAILLADCPNLDYACENQFFTTYMISRYGTWESAYNFWVANQWW